MGRSWLSLLLFLSLTVWTFSTYGQAVKYVSDVDQNLNFKTLVCAPLADNVSGIYANPLNDVLKSSLEFSHQWETTPLDKSITSSPEEFEASADSVKAAVKKSGGDALVSGRVSKGPNGVTIKLTLYSGSDGLPVGSETLSNYSGFEISDLKTQTQNLVKLLRAKLPFHGKVISRKGQLVTMNIGASSGLRPGVEAAIVQVIKVHRHPKFGFIISTDNLVLGKVQINKVDDYLSFGTITSEREANVIVAGAKVSLGNSVQYPDSNVMSDGKLITDLADRPDHQLAFGDHPKEWVPETPPSFGKFGLMFGLGTYSISNGLSTGAVTGSSSAVPSLHLNGELWFSPNWAMDLHIRDYVGSVSNGTGGNLNFSVQQAALDGTYSFLMNDDFYGPKLQTGVGYSTTQTNIDASTAFESTGYSGLYIRLAGSLPVTSAEKFPFIMGGRLDYFFAPNQSESPGNSGSGGGVQVNSFSIFGDKRMSERMNLHGEVMLDSMSASFSGAGSRAIQSSSSSQSFMTFAFGVDFLF